MSNGSKSWISALLFCALASGCGGTETGNPTNNKTNNNPISVSEGLLDTICSKLAQCQGLGHDACLSGVKASSSIDTEIGLASGFGTFQSIIDAEKAGTITGDRTAAGQCDTAISNLSCSSTEVTGAYDPSSPSDFSAIHQIVTSNAGYCPSVY
jgi:hypothetical protein